MAGKGSRPLKPWKDETDNSGKHMNVFAFATSSKKPINNHL
ncbi:MAG: hypothetical protein ACI8VW_001491, partial [bacterium]